MSCGFAAAGAQPLVARLGERRVHHGERHLDDRGGLVALEVPRMERMRDPGAEAERVGEAERRVVAEAEPAERNEIPVRVDAEVVVAMPGERPGEALEHPSSRRASWSMSSAAR